MHGVREELLDLQAEKADVPPYIVLSDLTLQELCSYLPLSSEDLKYIAGFSDMKMEMYGEEISELIREFCREKGLKTKVNEAQAKKFFQ